MYIKIKRNCLLCILRIFYPFNNRSSTRLSQFLKAASFLMQYIYSSFRAIHFCFEMLTKELKKHTNYTFKYLFGKHIQNWQNERPNMDHASLL